MKTIKNIVIVMALLTGARLMAQETRTNSMGGVGLYMKDYTKTLTLRSSYEKGIESIYDFDGSIIFTTVCIIGKRFWSEI